MNYPVLILKKSDSNIYALNKMFGIVSVGGESFYKNTTVIDSSGSLLEVEKVEIEKRASLKYCLMYFQKMLKLKITFSSNKKRLELNELKIIIIDKITKNPKKWLSMGSVEEITKHINNTNNFSELILMFR